MRDFLAKILDRRAAQAARRKARDEGKVFVFTNGCFDILHAGHVDYLNFARRQGDILAVGVNSDRSIRELKGPRRPVVPEQERARLLAALECVDCVVIFDETHVDRLIGELLPDILVKGQDRADWVCGRELVEQNGGRVVLAPVTAGCSTTDIIGSVLSSYGAAKPV